MKRWIAILVAVTATGCASIEKQCASSRASTFGSDWLVVQYAQDGRPFHCWKLQGAVVESSSGGNVDWQDPANGHLVHLTGWENRVQVVHGDFAGAAALIGVDASRCANGTYPAIVERPR